MSDLGITNVATKIAGLPDWYIEQGPQDLLRESYGLTAEGIYESAKALLAQRSSGRRSHRPPTGRDQFSTVSPAARRESDGDEQGS